MPFGQEPECGPAAVECRPAHMSAISEATNPVPWGVTVAANVGQKGPSSAGLALFECRPLHIASRAATPTPI
jgi:hypothetical protein